MLILLGIALKSLLIAGGTLALLALLRKRSPAERSCVAHIGLAALILLALAPLVLPSWHVEVPALSSAAAETPAAATPEVAKAKASPTPAMTAPALSASVDPLTVAIGIYALAAVALLLVTLVALGRLVMLQARAEVLVDSHWTSALARAQRRMGFKHGTALLTSNELKSPISWGLMRPVILLNDRAVEASDEAEAIIAHELAHVARLDWFKLLLARVACALFWFNPFVWVLAREAHQLREETADDAVLAADIPDTDYAQLLVGVARHECPGMLLGAHGVAPSKNSLSRRVARVLDVASVRSPAARPFALGVLAGAMLLAAPLAALTLTTDGSASDLKTEKALDRDWGDKVTSPYYSESDVPADLPSIISQGVAASVTGAVAAVTGDLSDGLMVSPSGASIERKNGTVVARAANGATVTTYPPDAQGRRKVVAISPSGATAIHYLDKDDRRDNDELDTAMEMKALGVTDQYIANLRAVSPALRTTNNEEFVQLKVVGVTPDYVRDLASAGFANLDADELVEARAVKVSPAYIREMRSAGFNVDLETYAEMRAVGVTAAFANEFRKRGLKIKDADQLIEMKVMGLDLDDLRSGKGVPPMPPTPPDLPDDG